MPISEVGMIDNGALNSSRRNRLRKLALLKPRARLLTFPALRYILIFYCNT